MQASLIGPMTATVSRQRGNEGKKPRQLILERSKDQVEMFKSRCQPEELKQRRPFFHVDGSFNWLGWAEWHITQPNCPVKYYGFATARKNEARYQKMMKTYVHFTPKPYHYEGWPNVDEVSSVLIDEYWRRNAD